MGPTLEHDDRATARRVLRSPSDHHRLHNLGEAPVAMTTPLTKSVKRELTIDGRSFIVTMSPLSLKITLKGKRKGPELSWTDLISGDAALASALNASLGQLEPPASAARREARRAR